MTASMPTQLSVKRNPKDGWYFYTCDLLPHFIHSSANDLKACEELPAKIQAELKLHFGIDCHVYSTGHYRNRTRQAAAAEHAFDQECDDEMAALIRFNVIQRAI